MAQDLPKQMKAVRCLEAAAGHYELQDAPVPQAKGTKVLLKIGAAGFCHTDLMLLTGEFRKKDTYPVTGSHEPAGTIVALGEEAEKEGKLQVGDRVAALLPIDLCGECADCKLGDWKYCPNSYYTGLNANGAFAEYELVEGFTCVKLPDDMSFEQAAPLTCAGVTIWTAIKKAGLKPGEVIGISGLGALGYLGVQFAKAAGLKVVGVDSRPEPIELCRSLKAELRPDLILDASNTSAEDAKQQIGKLRADDFFGWDGCDAVILTADPLEAQRYALDIVRTHGKFVLVSQPPKLEYTFNDLIFKDLTLVGSLHGNTQDLQETVDLAAKHGIRSELTVYKMEDHKELVESMHKTGRKGKAVMIMT